VSQEVAMGQRTIAEDFIHRLQEAEKTSNPRTLIELFSGECELMNLTRHNTSTKADHAGSPSQFWRQYLHAFQNVDSHFTSIIDDGKKAVLEWHSSGILPMGLPIEYNGVSILEYEDGLIQKFRTYYDSAAFLPHAPNSEKTYSQSVGAPEITNEATS
jgi:ketosteroid isomerase-like protein